MLARVLLQKNLEESWKLLGVDTTPKKRKFSNMQSDIVENVMNGLTSIGKKTWSKDTSTKRRVILQSIIGIN